MPKETTKAQRILSLYAKGLSTSEIAARVDCLPEYVRVVARQRKGKGQSEIDKRYLASPLGSATRRKLDERMAPYHTAYNQILRDTVDPEIVNVAARRAYRAARKAGKSLEEAKAAASCARTVAYCTHGDRAAAREAGRAAMGKGIF